MAITSDKARVQITLPRPLLEKMDAYCDEAGVTRSGYVSLLVSKDLEKTEDYLVELKKQLTEVIDKMGLEEKPI